MLKITITPRPDYIAAGLLLLLSGLLYLLTLDNGLRPNELSGGDLITHQYAQVEARPSNAPGYPLYTMGGWLWFHGPGQLLRPWLNPIQILSLYSTLWSVAALGVLYAILRPLSHNWPIPTLLTACHASTYFFWYYSVTTEQYSSALFQTLLMVWLAFRWEDRPRDSLLLAMACLSGTMLANMVTTLFILPPLLGFIFLRRKTTTLYLWHYLRRPRLVMQAILLTALPLLSYGYIYLRGAQHPEWRGAGHWPSAWAWFVDFLTIQQGRDELAPGLTLSNLITPEFPALMWQELTPFLFFSGLLGIALLGRRRAIFLYSTLLIYLLFCTAYRFGNWFQVIIPAYPLLLIGVTATLNWLTQRLQPRSHALLSMPLLLLLIFNLSRNLPRANQHNQPDDTGLNPGWAILADNPQPPATLHADYPERLAMQYLQTMWQRGHNLTIIEPNASVIANKIYATRQALTINPALTSESRHPQASGVILIELRAKPRTSLPPSAQTRTLSFTHPTETDELHLRGWEINPHSPPWHLILYWQTPRPLNRDYVISVRPMVSGQLLTRNGEPLIQDHQPVWGFYPTHRWTAQEIIADSYALPLPQPPDAMQIVVYYPTAAGFENLGVHTIPLD